MQPKKTPKINDLVVVEWIDITAEESWLSLEEALTCQPIKVLSVGWMIAIDENYIRLSSTWSDDAKRNVQIIPIGCVTLIKRVKYDG